MRTAPWPDFIGQTIQEGDTIRHLDGSYGTVVYIPCELPSDSWRIRYEGDPVGRLPRLCLAIGDRGQAIVVKT